MSTCSAITEAFLLSKWIFVFYERLPETISSVGRGGRRNVFFKLELLVFRCDKLKNVVFKPFIRKHPVVMMSHNIMRLSFDIFK